MGEWLPLAVGLCRGSTAIYLFWYWWLRSVSFIRSSQSQADGRNSKNANPTQTSMFASVWCVSMVATQVAAKSKHYPLVDACIDVTANGNNSADDVFFYLAHLKNERAQRNSSWRKTTILHRISITHDQLCVVHISKLLRLRRNQSKYISIFI